METLRTHPGMNKSRLGEAVGLSWATTTYHLKILETQGAVHLERRGRRDVLCFPVGVPVRFRPWLATLLDTSSLRVLDALGHDELGVAELSRRRGLSESALRRQLGRLEGAGIVLKRGQLRPRFARNPELPEPSQDTDR
ncbi:MAG: winged helix-turn-helix transcriptional regulator [Thermoplasmatota archaeon]|nr:winged helix-turn-helix transcriptional regulator [Halobacteriales archaeon]